MSDLSGKATFSLYIHTVVHHSHTYTVRYVKEREVLGVGIVGSDNRIRTRSDVVFDEDLLDKR